jgi:hypothetical protein
LISHQNHLPSSGNTASPRPSECPPRDKGGEMGREVRSVVPWCTQYSGTKEDSLPFSLLTCQTIPETLRDFCLGDFIAGSDKARGHLVDSSQDAGCIQCSAGLVGTTAKQKTQVARSSPFRQVRLALWVTKVRILGDSGVRCLRKQF